MTPPVLQSLPLESSKLHMQRAISSVCSFLTHYALELDIDSNDEPKDDYRLVTFSLALADY